jgi:hypothetical protein
LLSLKPNRIDRTSTLESATSAESSSLNLEAFVS